MIKNTFETNFENDKSSLNHFKSTSKKFRVWTMIFLEISWVRYRGIFELNLTRASPLIQKVKDTVSIKIKGIFGNKYLLAMKNASGKGSRCIRFVKDLREMVRRASTTAGNNGYAHRIWYQLYQICIKSFSLTCKTLLRNYIIIILTLCMFLKQFRNDLYLCPYADFYQQPWYLR